MQRNGFATRLLFGIVLIAIGITLFAAELGAISFPDLGRIWPAFLIAFGVIRLLVPGDRGGRGSGVWLLVTGIYCGIAVWHLFGLTWATAWPLLLIGYGAAIVGRSLLRSAGSSEVQDEH